MNSNKQHNITKMWVAVFLTLILSLGLAGTVLAGDIIVDESTCTLVNAITSANTDTATGGCTFTGTPGADTITFDDDYTIDVSSGELTISDELTIDGEANTIIIDAGNNNRIFNITAPTTLINLQLQNGNTAGNGGAIYSTAPLIITGTDFISNTATTGGALYVASGTDSIINSDFISNTANSGGTGGGGGAVYVAGGTATISASNFEANTAPLDWGGALHTGPGTIVLENSTLMHNSAKHGGAMHIGDSGNAGTGIVTNTTIYSNTATATDHGGGGVRIGTGASASFYNSTIAYNHGSTGSGLSEVNTPFHLINTIVANNTRSENCYSNHSGGILDTDTNNLIVGTTSCGTPAVTSDPQLGALEQTGLGGTWVLPLQSGSPAIEKADTASAPATDQRGVARPQGCAADIGAYELDTVPACPYPGGVGAGLDLWLKADADVYTDAGSTLATHDDNVQQWHTQAGTVITEAQIATSTNITYTNNAVNFNPAVQFDGTSAQRLRGTSSKDFSGAATIFAVAKDEGTPTEVLGVFSSSGNPDAEAGGQGIYARNYGEYIMDGSGAWDPNSANTTTPSDDLYRVVTGYYSDTGTTEGTSIYLDGGLEEAYNSPGVGIDAGSTFEIGGRTWGTTHDNRIFTGEIAEVIYYDGQLGAADQNKVESYLALKYGITLTGTQGISYTLSDGTVVWDADANAMYHNDVAGIAIDHGSVLTQTMSRSVNDDSIVTVGSPSDLAEGEALVWGNNNDVLTGTTEVPTGYYRRLARAWFVQQTDDVGTVDLSFDLSNITDTPDFDHTGFALLIDDDGDFSDATAVTGASVTGSVVTFSGVDLANGDIFSLAYPKDGDPTLDMSKTAEDVNGAPLEEGDAIAYTLVLTNLLNSAQAGVAITDSLPISTTFVTSATTQGTITGPDPLVVDVDPLAALDTVTFVFTVTVKEGALGKTIQNTAQAGSPSNPDPIEVGPIKPPDGGEVVDVTEPKAPEVTEPVTGTTTGDPTPPFEGTGEAGATISVTNASGVVLCTAEVDDDGNWTCTPDDPLPEGEQTATVVQIDPAGNISDPTEVTFTVDSIKPDAPEVTAPVTGTTTSDPTPPFEGKGEPGATISVTNESGVLLCTATVDDGGNWTCTPDDPLPEGEQTVTVVQIDPAGNISDPTEVTFTVDSIKPDAPKVTAPEPGSTITDTTPIFTGTGEPGATISVTNESGVLLCIAEVDDGGNWSCPPENPLPEGEHTATVVQIDPSGNISEPTEVTFTIADVLDDTDGDGVPDVDEDVDGDGDPTNDDTDGDGIPDYEDTDDDGDGIPTVDECPGGPTCRDSDGDGLPDYRDDDDDDDGILTEDEDLDDDGDPTDDDTDGDGTPNYLDDDDDGDDLPTAAECTDPAACEDEDGDGIPDYLEDNNADTDGDGKKNHEDDDDDGDTVPTANECPGGPACPDSDGDGTPDYLDSDDDNDGKDTIDEDTNGNGDPTDDDADGDGLPDFIEPGNVDTDGDGKDNEHDDDDDGDGIPTAAECPDAPVCKDTDDDGTPDYLDDDDDGDGIPTAEECPNAGACPDTDNNGIPDYLDPANAVLSVSKTAETDGDGLATYGSVVTYTIVISNSGDGVATNVVLTDPLPSAIVSIGWLEDQSVVQPLPPTVRWEAATFPAQAVYTLSFTATLSSDTELIGDSVVNTVYFSAEDAPGGQIADDGFTIGVGDNVPPTAEDDSFEVPEGITSPLDVQANDSDADGDTLSLVAVGTPQHGTAVISGTQVLYTPTLGYIGPDSFTYTVSDGIYDVEATVNVTVLPVADLEVTQELELRTGTVIFTLVAQNLGERPADNAVISDTFNAGMTSVTWTCVSAGGAVCTASGAGNIFSDTLTSFPNGGVVTYTVSAQVPPTLVVANRVTIVPPAGVVDLNWDNNSDLKYTGYRYIFPVYMNSGDKQTSPAQDK